MIKYPEYNRSILSVASSVLNYFGVKDCPHKTLPEFDKLLNKNCKNVIVMLFDRASLSKENGYIDSNGNVIVFMTNSQACDLLSCSHEKVSKLFKELEAFNLIERKKQGLCRTLIIYPKLPS